MGGYTNAVVIIEQNKDIVSIRFFSVADYQQIL